MPQIPRKNEEIIWREMDGETVLLNPMTGRYFGLNTVACSFWTRVDGAASLENIIDQLLEEYDVDRDTLKTDIDSLIASMLEYELIILK